MGSGLTSPLSRLVFLGGGGGEVGKRKARSMCFPPRACRFWRAVSRSRARSKVTEVGVSEAMFENDESEARFLFYLDGPVF